MDVALALLPHDIDVCISLDLDEVMEDGWQRNRLQGPTNGLH